MNSFFNDLFDYNYYCNKLIIEAALEDSKFPDKATVLFNHILNAHHIWNARILNTETPSNFWQKNDPINWEEMHYDNQRTTFGILTDATNFEEEIIFTNTEKAVLQSSLKKILFHIINHSTYHRGQIATLMKTHNAEPISTDYIYYKN